MEKGGNITEYMTGIERIEIGISQTIRSVFLRIVNGMMLQFILCHTEKLSLAAFLHTMVSQNTSSLL